MEHHDYDYDSDATTITQELITDETFPQEFSRGRYVHGMFGVVMKNFVRHESIWGCSVIDKGLDALVMNNYDQHIGTFDEVMVRDMFKWPKFRPITSKVEFRRSGYDYEVWRSHCNINRVVMTEDDYKYMTKTVEAREDVMYYDVNELPMRFDRDRVYIKPQPHPCCIAQLAHDFSRDDRCYYIQGNSTGGHQRMCPHLCDHDELSYLAWSHDGRGILAEGRATAQWHPYIAYLEMIPRLFKRRHDHVVWNIMSYLPINERATIFGQYDIIEGYQTFDIAKEFNKTSHRMAVKYRAYFMVRCWTHTHLHYRNLMFTISRHHFNETKRIAFDMKAIIDQTEHVLHTPELLQNSPYFVGPNTLVYPRKPFQWYEATVGETDHMLKHTMMHHRLITLVEQLIHLESDKGFITKNYMYIDLVRNKIRQYGFDDIITKYCHILSDDVTRYNICLGENGWMWDVLYETRITTLLLWSYRQKIAHILRYDNSMCRMAYYPCNGALCTKGAGLAESFLWGGRQQNRPYPYRMTTIKNW